MAAYHRFVTDDDYRGRASVSGAHVPLTRGLDLDDLLWEIRDRAAGAQQSQERLAGLLDAVVAVSSNLDLGTVLSRIVESAAALVDARYGALAVMDRRSRRVSEFITHGLSEAERLAIGEPPVGRGVLGLLLSYPHSIRLPDLTSHPAAAGFPPNHPVMRSFLGAPIRVREEVFGNLYLTEKRGGGEFTDNDEAVLTALAAAAGIAIDNAQLYRRSKLTQQWVQAVGELTQTLLEGRNERAALARMVRRSRDLGNAELGILAVKDDTGHLVIQAAAAPSGDAHRLLGYRLSGQRWSLLLSSRVPLLLLASEEDEHVGVLTAELRGAAGLPAPGCTAIVPVTVGEVEVGLIALSWDAEHAFQAAETLEALTTFGDQMGLAIEAFRAQRQRARTALLEDRDRIARDMHDHVIQRLFAAGLSLQSAARLAQEPVRGKLTAAIDELDTAVKQIRQAIFELHHPLAEGGLGPELESVVERAAEGFGFEPDMTIEGLLADIPFEYEADVVAVVREGLSNGIRHARAGDARVRVSTLDDLVITIRDDGLGTRWEAARSGLLNLRERALARGGSFRLEAVEPSGTQLVWRVPLPGRRATVATSAQGWPVT